MKDGKIHRLVAGGTMAWKLEMSWNETRKASEVVKIDENDVGLQNTLRWSYGESQRNMVDEFSILKEGKERRMKLMEGLMFREEKKISIKERWLDSIQDARVGNFEIALRRI